MLRYKSLTHNVLDARRNIVASTSVSGYGIWCPVSEQCDCPDGDRSIPDREGDAGWLGCRLGPSCHEERVMA